MIFKNCLKSTLHIMEASNQEELPQASKARRGIRTEWVVAGSSILISCCALFVSIYQAQLLRKQTEAQIWPYLNYFTFNATPNDSTLAWGFRVINTGTGPAMVKSVDHFWNGQEIGDVDTLYKLALADMRKQNPNAWIHVQYNSLNPGRVIQSGEQLDFITLTSVYSEYWNELSIAFQKNYRVVYRYGDLLGNEWQFDSTQKSGGWPVPVK